jgi:hypothetical protein
MKTHIVLYIVLLGGLIAAPTSTPKEELKVRDELRMQINLAKHEHKQNQSAIAESQKITNKNIDMAMEKFQMADSTAKILKLKTHFLAKKMSLFEQVTNAIQVKNDTLFAEFLAYKKAKDSTMLDSMIYKKN